MQEVVFGVGAPSDVTEVDRLLDLAARADRSGVDLLSVSDHAYLGGQLDAYAAISFVLGRTTRLAAFVNVTNLPTRPAPMLARTVTSLSALSGGRVVLGLGAGGRLDRIGDLGAPRLEPGAAVEAFEEAIGLIRALSGGGGPVTQHGRHYRVEAIEPAGVPVPPIWTGSNGPRSLAVTGRMADGWIPGHAADWLSPRYRQSRPLIDAAARAVGRDPAEIRTVYNLPGRITSADLPATRGRDGRWVGGSVRQWVEELTGAVLEHGAGGFTLFGPGGASGEAQLEPWGLEIAPAVRAAVLAEAVGRE